MNELADIPLWAAVIVSLLLLAGAAMTLIGAIGLLRLPTFYERVHAPTIATSSGLALTLMASMLFFTVSQSRLVLHEVLIGIVVVITTPVTLMLVARASLHRDRLEGGDVPPPLPRRGSGIPEKASQ
ncbi:monovalent cation/H(+) antiporter subunit G [Pseudoroseomonas globiformis]|uniref:Monovalent cation/H(+) antiporter subunit G n=1 Tax=Teichococcus globiformis TaxID=2307229 RepID=A0ABV7G8A9_9PROT